LGYLCPNDESVARLLPSQISVELRYATRMYDLEWMVRQRQAGEITMFKWDDVQRWRIHPSGEETHRPRLRFLPRGALCSSIL